MRRLRNILMITLIAMVAMVTAQCGDKDTKAGNIDIEVIPDEPIMIDAPITVTEDGEEVTYPGPYFRFDLTITNNNEPGESTAQETERTLVITAFVGKIYDPGGNVIGEFALDAGEENKLYFFELAPGESGTLSDQTSSIWYIYDIDVPEDQTNFRYRVQLDPKGWFGTSTDAKERFNGKFSFYTQ